MFSHIIVPIPPDEENIHQTRLTTGCNLRAPLHLTSLLLRYSVISTQSTKYSVLEIKIFLSK